MLEAVSMMGEANYAETDTIRGSAVKHALFVVLTFDETGASELLEELRIVVKAA